MAVYDDRDASHTQFMQTTSLVNYAGAAVSLALVVGVSMWGYQLIVRDVSGIPVVRAAEGAMRVAPQNAGGEIADHAGLAVNEVVGQGEAAGPTDSLLLAPQREALADEDLRVEPTAEADEVLPVASAQAPEQEVQTALEAGLGLDGKATLTTDDLLKFADEVAATATPLTPLAEGEAVPPTVALDGEVVTAQPQFLDASVPGIAQSLRPIIRPASLVVATPVSADAASVTPQARQIPDTSTAVAAALAEATLTNAAALTPGTHLVQLGAYPSAEMASSEWSRISGQFSEFMNGKDMVVQEAESAGTTFYRLRASGFGEAADARRFCAALSAGNADCIPVVVQ